MACYAGPFLHGVHIDSREFEEWADGERARIEGEFGSALERLAQSATSHGAAADAAAHWCRLAQSRPLDSRIALEAARALAAAGDRGGALNQLRGHEARIREELDIDADPGIAAAIAELRLARTSGPTRALPDGQLDPSMPEPIRSRPAASRSRLRMAIVGFLVLGLGLGGASLMRSHEASDTGKRVAVLPFRFRGDTAYAYLGPGVVSVMSSVLDGVGSLRAVDPQAVFAAAGEPGSPDVARVSAAIGAPLMVSGDLVEIGGHLRIVATLLDESRTSVTASAEGPASQFLTLVDQVATELVARTGLGDATLLRTAATTTTSYAALRAYLEGESLMRAGRYAEAVEHFQQAVSADSTFVIALYRLNIAQDWASSPIRTGSTTLGPLAARLPEHERLIVEALAAWRMGSNDEAEAKLRHVLSQYPDDVTAWYELGEVLFHDNPRHGRLIEESRQPFERVLALDRHNVEAMIHLSRIAARETRTDTAIALVDRALAERPDAPSPELSGYRAALAGDTGAERAILEGGHNNPELPGLIAWRSAVYARNWDAAGRALMRASARDITSELRRFAYIERAELDVGRGRWRSALAALDTLVPIDSAAALGLRAEYLSYDFAPDFPAARDSVRQRLQRWDAGRIRLPFMDPYRVLIPLYRPYLIGLLLLHDGDTSGARQRVQAIEDVATTSAGLPYRSSLANGLRAMIDYHGHRLVAALAETAAAADVGPWATDQSQDVYDNPYPFRFLRGRALGEIGKWNEAVGWLGSIDERMIAGMPYLGPSLQALAAGYRRRGEHSAEAATLRLLIRLWDRCDPEIRPQLDSARAELAKLQ